MPWPTFGGRLRSPTVRISLAGAVSVEISGELIPADRFPGQQGRLAFAYLVLERGRPVTHSELAEVLWPSDLPQAWEGALSSIVSKLRSLIGTSRTEGAPDLAGTRGAYELRLPGDAWIDVEAAAEAIHEAEAALRADDPRRGYGASAVAHHIARRPFFPGERGAWIEAKRDRLRDILLRALEARAAIYLWNREDALALQCAKDLIALEPFRETGHRLIMRAHSTMGNSAEALRAYEHCRKLIARELGVDPSPQTKQEYESVLRAL